jgi:hypothetical protein
MALTSPGVQVSVIDESFYTTAEPGTRPLFIVATAANKTPSSGTGTALGTTSAYNGRVWTITSQRELAETFGDPTFKIDTNNNPIHAGELNEYGLQAAYSYLGVSNSALVIRAELDLNELLPGADAPGGDPEDGTFWLDTANSTYGIFQWDGRSAVAGGQTFTNKKPLISTDGTFPVAADTAAGTYLVVAGQDGEEELVQIYYRSQYATDGANDGASWVLVGSDEWVTAHPTITGTGSTSISGKSITFNDTDTVVSTSGSTIDSLVSDINGLVGSTTFGARKNDAGKLEIFATDAQLESISITGDSDLLTAIGVTAGEYMVPKTQISKHTEVPQYKSSGQNRPSGSVWIKTTEPNAGARWRVKKYNAATMLWEQLAAPIYKNNSVRVDAGYYDQTANKELDPLSFIVLNSALSSRLPSDPPYNPNIPGTLRLEDDANRNYTGRNIIVDTVYVEYDDTPYAVFKVKRRNTTSTWVTMPNTGSTTRYYFVSNEAPTTLTADGKLWYSSVVDEVDILVNDGNTWVGYANMYEGVDPYGPTVSATQPKTQQDGSTSLVDMDLWVDTSDLENYPILKRYNSSFRRWELVDTTDQTTESGIVFADARWGLSGPDSTPAPIAVVVEGEATTDGLNKVNFVDFDAPDPALYPQGMLLWNTRRSGFNVKRFVQNYVDLTKDNNRYDREAMGGTGSPGAPGYVPPYYPHRWVTESGNQADGSGSFGRHAQRKVVIQSLQALVNSNEAIRDTERNGFNLLATPGYPELIGEMINLNNDRGLTAFVVGDSPARLNPSATNLNNWGTNLAGSLQDDDMGLVSRDEYMGVFYPWGFTSDNFGRDIAVPPSHMILRMIALNDQAAYPWFAPAGTRRGGITNATAVGYVTAEGEFSSVALNDGQRDTLYNVAVNPITYFTGAGLVNFGQKTRARGASALDRINVARLVIFLRNQLNKLAKPYIFEPNDKITRDEIKQQIESLLLELVGQRALYDFLVVCDESNNTPNRIDRSELHVDIAIEPVKAVEFIYIPVRLKNTGEIAGLGK